MKTCDKCSKLPQNGFIYIIDQSKFKKLRNKSMHRNDTYSSLASLASLDSDFSMQNNTENHADELKPDAQLERKLTNTPVGISILSRTHYACGEHKDEVKKDMLDNLQNLNQEYGGNIITNMEEDANIVPFAIKNQVKKSRWFSK